MAECNPNATRRVPLEFAEDGSPRFKSVCSPESFKPNPSKRTTPISNMREHPAHLKSSSDATLLRKARYGVLPLLATILSGCGGLPVTNSLPEPQAKVELKIFRDYATAQSQPWKIALLYEPQVLIPGESASFEEVQKGNIIFRSTSTELSSIPVGITLPDSAVQKTGENTFTLSIPRETLDSRPGNYILKEMDISKGGARIIRAKVISPKQSETKRTKDSPHSCVYSQQLKPNPTTPILRAKYHGGILQFEGNEPPNYTSASTDCEILIANPLFTYLPNDKVHGLLAEREIDHILALGTDTHSNDPYYSGIELFQVRLEHLQRAPVWEKTMKQYPYISAWYWKRNGKLIKATYCADKKRHPTATETLLCSGPWGESYFYNGHQFAVSKRKDIGGDDKPNWRFEYSSFIETELLGYYIQYGRGWSKRTELTNADQNNTPPDPNILSQLLSEETFWVHVAQDTNNPRLNHRKSE